MNSQTANAALKRIGYGGKLVAHGLRSIASTTLNEAGFNSDVIEAALAHTDKNEVRRAYNRSIYLKQRIGMMEWWGEKVYNKNLKKKIKAHSYELLFSCIIFRIISILFILKSHKGIIPTRNTEYSKNSC